jgi:hypothetical protein
MVAAKSRLCQRLLISPPLRKRAQAYGCDVIWPRSRRRIAVVCSANNQTLAHQWRACRRSDVDSHVRHKTRSSCSASRTCQFFGDYSRRCCNCFAKGEETTEGPFKAHQAGRCDHRSPWWDGQILPCRRELFLRRRHWRSLRAILKLRISRRTTYGASRLNRRNRDRCGPTLTPGRIASVFLFRRVFV